MEEKIYESHKNIDFGGFFAEFYIAQKRKNGKV
jgi:hypothetical protein